MSDESAGGPHAAPMAVTPPASLSAPEAWGGRQAEGQNLKREKPPFGEERREMSAYGSKNSFKEWLISFELQHERESE